MPDIPAATKEQLLLHQFIHSYVPQKVSKQLRAMDTTTKLTETVEQAKLLMTIEHHCAVAAKQLSCLSFYICMQEKLTDLSEQVVAILFRSILEASRMWGSTKVLYL